MSGLLRFLQARSVEGLLPLRVQAEAAQHFSFSLAKVEEVALANNILPARYQRNREMLSLPQQLTLLRSRVAIFGCGGLGGYIIEELARLGAGAIVAVDPDVFVEHNLNRQLLATVEVLGENKAVAAARRAAAVNPAVMVLPVAEAFGEDNGDALLQGVDVALDALDSIPVRLRLAATCDRLGIPLVHGAIAGWYGQVATQFPGDRTLERIYRLRGEPQGIEASQGNPSFTPAVVASLQVAEAVKILLKTGVPLRHRYLAIDLYHLEVDEIHLPPAETTDS